MTDREEDDRGENRAHEPFLGDADPPSVVLTMVAVEA